MRPALLVIDVQNEYFAPYGQWVLPEGEKALGMIQQLLTSSRATHVPIFHIVHESLDPQSAVFRSGTPGIDMHPAITVMHGEKQIVKHFPGSFTQTALEANLQQLNIDTLIICGFMTHMCCDTTTRQARERRFNIMFASDATATRDLKRADHMVPYQTIQESTLAVMGHFAEILSTDEICSRIGQ